jgi:hypothetical protein
MRRELRDRAAIAARPAVDVGDVLAVAEGREGRDPELGGQRREPVLRRPDPLAARLDDLAGTISWLSVRPPTRSRASSTTTRFSARVRSRAATSPARPAPTTITSTSSAALTIVLCHSTSPTTASAS